MKEFKVMVQNIDEGHWDEIYKGSYQRCFETVEEFKNDPENDGTWIDIKVVDVKAFSDTELQIMFMALSQYYNELIDESYGEDYLIRGYLDEKKQLWNKLKGLVK